MNQKLVLENAGDEATMTVSECRTVQTKFGNKLVFVGITPEWDGPVETPLIPDATAIKRLNDLGLTPETSVGETLKFWRKENPGGKPYWIIDVAGPQAAPSKRLAPPTAIPTEVVGGLDARMSIANAYLALYRHVRGTLPQESAEAVQAATATIWISWDKRGLQPDGKDAQTPAIPTTPAPSGKRLAPPSSVVRGSPAGEHDFSKVPPPTDADFTDDLPFD